MTDDQIPVTESTLSAHYLGQLLLELYSLDRTTTCKLFRTGINHLYFVSALNSKFVFRVYTLNWRSRLEISEEVRLLNHLRVHNLPVAYPIADRHGHFIQELSAPEGNRFGVLFSFADGGKVREFNARTSFGIGQAMASMHQVTENLALKRVTYSSDTLLEASYSKTRSFFRRDSHEMTFVEKTTRYLIQEYGKVDTTKVRYGAIHLDIWFDNLHVHGEDEVTIFDFDFCGNGWLCHDIAYFMLQLYNTRSTDEAYKNNLDSFLNGYESVAEISAEEKRIIPIIAISIWFFYLGVQCDRFDNWSNVFLSEDHLKRFILTIKRWIAYHKIPIDDVWTE